MANVPAGSRGCRRPRLDALATRGRAIRPQGWRRRQRRGPRGPPAHDPLEEEEARARAGEPRATRVVPWVSAEIVEDLPDRLVEVVLALDGDAQHVLHLGEADDDGRGRGEADQDGVGQEVDEEAEAADPEHDVDDTDHEREEGGGTDVAGRALVDDRGEGRRRSATRRWRRVRRRAAGTSRTARRGRRGPWRRRARPPAGARRAGRRPSLGGRAWRRRSGRRRGRVADRCAGTAAPTSGSAAASVRWP